MSLDSIIQTDYCVTPDNVRERLRTPKIVGQYVYATNGEHFIKVPMQMLAQTYECVSDVPDYERTFARAYEGKFDAPETIPVARLKAVLAQIPLSPDYAICDTCDGDGETTCGHCDVTSECKKCKGTGEDKSLVIGQYYDFDKTIALYERCRLWAEYVNSLVKVAEATGIEEIQYTASGNDINAFQVGDILILIMTRINFSQSKMILRGQCVEPNEPITAMKWEGYSETDQPEKP